MKSYELPAAAPGESSEEILNRLISGQGVKRNNRI